MCPFLEKKLFYLDYGCLRQKCGMKLSSVSVTGIDSPHIVSFFLPCSLGNRHWVRWCFSVVTHHLVSYMEKVFSLISVSFLILLLPF